MTREEIQKEAVTLALNNDTVLLQWCTGLGKTKAAIDSVSELCELDLNKTLDVLFVVAEVAHKENWLKEISKFGIAPCRIVMECYASLKKYKNTNWDIVILDECHHINSDIRMDIISTMKINKLIGLSATIPSETFIMLGSFRKSMGFPTFASSRISLKDAINAGILPKPKVYLIPLTLNNTNNDCTITEEWGLKNKRKTIKCTFSNRWEYLANRIKYPNTTLIISCTQEQKYFYLTEQYNYWYKQFIRNRQERTKNKWLQCGSKRKRFLGEIKTPYVETLLEQLKDKRFICFCNSIEQAELLGNNNSIHSKKGNSLEIINNFNSKQIDNIFAVGMLQEGQNLTDIEIGIIVQLDGQERAFIQKFGRSLRAEDPIQYIFYFKNTKDTDYLENVLEGVDSSFITELQITTETNVCQQ